MKHTLVMVALCAGAAAWGGSAVDFSRTVGPVKPVNGVGQPPIQGWNGYKMFHYLTEAGVPYSRLHDVGGPFGKNVYVDVPNLFRDFEADENDPASYDFAFTDGLLKALVEAGVEPYFRLGVTIENAQKVKVYRISPPKDFAKWARVCEHIVRHYTEGWANGFRHDISHWEIWNEPDSFEKLETNLMWKDSFDRYCDLYVTAAKHLKKAFPHLKVGGYASCGFYGVSSAWASPKNPRIPHLMGCFTNFLTRVRAAEAPLDFFSYHCYDRPVHAARQVAYCRKTLDDFGFAKTETSLNEWLPCNGGSRQAEIGTAGQAAQIAAMLALMQNGPVDDAEIYDARATGGSYAPLFAPETHAPRKAYYVYCAFNELRKLGKAVDLPAAPEGLWACAATDGGDKAAVLVANVSKAPIALPYDFGAYRIVRARVIDETSTWEPATFGGAVGPESVWLLELSKSSEPAKVAPEIAAARAKFAAQRFGVFVHWGLYANYAQGEWYLQQGRLDREAYERMKDGFCPSKFDAREWVRIVKGAGAKYLTITSRHHDGFSLWPTKADDGYNIANTPFGRDILGELATACREEGIQLNFYYSLMDWHRADYPAGTAASAVLGPQKGDYGSYKRFMMAQLSELLDGYHPGNIWFDGEWEHAKHQPNGTWSRTLDWGFDEMYDLIHAKGALVANNNHQPVREKEDIQLFERDLPGDSSDAGFCKNMTIVHDWPIEQCDVIQKNVWGYRIGEKSFRTAPEVVAMVARAASKDSNLLMNVGPDGSGRFPDRAEKVMAEVGAWFEKNGESIYGTTAGGVALLKSVVSTRKDDVLYLHFLDPAVNTFVLRMKDAEIIAATYLASGEAVPVARTPEGDVVVKMNRPKGDAFDLVVKLTLKPRT